MEETIKEYEDKLEFFGNNDVFEIEQKFEKDDDISDDNYNQRRKNNKNRKEIDNFEKNEDQLSHDVVIEYEDGIDQNVEINYEEDDLANEYDYEKEKEMINKGLNPYNSENNRFNTKKHSVLNKERIIANNKNRRLIINDNDESDKCLKEFLQNKDERRTNNIRKKNKKSENVDYLFVSDIDNKDFSDINDDNKKPKKQNKKKLTDYNYQLVKKNVFSIKSTMPSNVISDNRIYPTPQQRIKTQKDLEKLSAMELEHYNRVQRIMNAGPKVNNIFGINNYNPENSMNSINVGSDLVFSPKKNVSQLQTSSNKIDKTIRIGSKQNHNFISIINMTKNVPLKKKKEKDKTKMKEKRKESRGNDEGIIQIINLEENFLNELKEDEKNENEKLNKTGNESTSNITNNNNSKRNNSNEIIDNDDNSKNNINSNVIKNNNNNNKNEVQGYYLNIINTKQQNKEKENKEINVIEEKDKEDNNLKNKKNENNELFMNTNKKTLKITKSRELNINDLKNNKIGIMNKKIVSKTNIPKNIKAKAKLIYLNTAENKAGSTLNNTGVRPKTNNSSNKIVNRKIISNINISGNYVNINDSSIKRSHSISDNLQNKKEEIKNKFNNRKIIVNNNNSNNIININISPNIQKNRKISNIPVSKIKNSIRLLK